MPLRHLSRRPSRSRALLAAAAGLLMAAGVVSAPASAAPASAAAQNPAAAPSPAAAPALVAESFGTTDRASGPSTHVPIRPAPGKDVQPRFPIRAAFYYGWGSTSNHFNQSYGTDDPYANPRAPARAVQQMRYGGMNAGIASWLGRGTFADARMPRVIRGADGTPFRWALYYEPAGRSVAQLDSDMTYLRNRYGVDKNYLRVSGKPVMFVWAGGSFSCSQAKNWLAANKSRFYLVFKVFPGYTSCPYRPNAWHEYGPVNRSVFVPGNAVNISPGFWFTNSSRPILSRDPAAWDRAIKAMARSGVPWQLVTSYNEWGEGTAVSTAHQWQSGTGYGRYLDLLHVNLWRKGL